MHRVTRMSILAGMILALVVNAMRASPAYGHAAQDVGRNDPVATPRSETGATTLDPAIDRILTRLENRQISTLKAGVLWELEYAMEEGKSVKTGTIWYKEMTPSPSFKVRFERKVVDGRQQRLNEEHLFDGRWYVELNSETRTVSRTELRPEGDTSNPYKLGEGAFPVPFGQSKADILREFEVALVPPSGEDPAKSDRLRLTPRSETAIGQTYRTIDFWIAQEGPLSGLPVKVLAAKLDGTGAVNSLITVTFRDVELDTGFSDSVLKIDTPRGYEEIVESLDRGPAIQIEIPGPP